MSVAVSRRRTGTASTDRVVRTTRRTARSGDPSWRRAATTNARQMRGRWSPLRFNQEESTSMFDRFNAWATALLPDSRRTKGQTFVEYALCSPSSSSASCSPSRGRASAPRSRRDHAVSNALRTRTTYRRRTVGASACGGGPDRTSHRRMQNTHTQDLSKLRGDAASRWSSSSIVLPILVMLVLGDLRSSASLSTTTSRSPTRRGSARAQPRSSGPASLRRRDDRDPEHRLGEPVGRDLEPITCTRRRRTPATRSRSTITYPYTHRPSSASVAQAI